MDNGQTNGGGRSSRLDRIEAALELIIQDHEEFRAEHKMLLKSQVVLQDVVDRGFAKAQEEDARLRERIHEIGDKLDGLIGAVDQMQRNFEARLRRLEENQPQ